jgi:predicted Rossmann-fold nucleotide-binding protein
MDKRTFEPLYDRRRKIIGVMGGKRDRPALTVPLGQLIASMGFHLLTGAGEGTMRGVSEAFFNTEGREGLVLGIVRAETACGEVAESGERPYIANLVNPWVEVPVYTHLHLSSQDCFSRNHINVLTSDVVIALPGNTGTASEVELALQYGVPLIFFLGGGLISGRSPDFYLSTYPGNSAMVAAEIVDVRSALESLLP